MMIDRDVDYCKSYAWANLTDKRLLMVELEP